MNYLLDKSFIPRHQLSGMQNNTHSIRKICSICFPTYFDDYIEREINCVFKSFIIIRISIIPNDAFALETISVTHSRRIIFFHISYSTRSSVWNVEQVTRNFRLYSTLDVLSWKFKNLYPLTQYWAHSLSILFYIP